MRENLAEVLRVFDGACELPGHRRAEFLARACDDVAVRNRVERLLRHYDRPPAMLDRSPLEGVAPPGSDPSLPASIGPYAVRALLGVGGMGVVYLAEQQATRRLFAIKVLRPIRAAVDGRARRRFEREAELLGRLKHAGIAQIYESSRVGPDPKSALYIVMEYVDGLPITTYANRSGLQVRARVDLVARVCDAIHHAHEHGIVHRDLKPENILVTADGQPKVIDFGIARPSDAAGRETRLTADGESIGTPSYMSPEQIRSDGRTIDGRSDVYALGVVAYELLAGRPPSSDGEHGSKKSFGSEVEPPLLGKLTQAGRGDLRVVLANALAAERERRYPSAAAFGTDLRRCLANRPIAARPASRWSRTRGFVRRHRVLLGAAAGLLAMAVGGTATLWYRSEAAESRRVAATRDRAALAHAYAAGLSFVQLALREARVDVAASRLHSLRRELGGSTPWEMRYLESRLEDRETILAAADAVEPTVGGEWPIAPLFTDAWIGQWDGRRLALEALPRLVVVSADRRVRAEAGADRHRIELAVGDSGERISLGTIESRIQALAIRPDGVRLAGSLDDSTVRVWEVATGSEVIVLRHPEVVFGIEYSPDCRRLVTGCGDGIVRVWDTRSGVCVFALVGRADSIRDVAFSSDGTRLAAISADATVRIWDAVPRRQREAEALASCDLRTSGDPDDGGVAD